MNRMAPFVLVAAALSLPSFADDPNDLQSACRKGDPAAVSEMLGKGVSIETKTPYGQTCLYLAAMNGHEELVRYLVDKGAETDVTDTFYKAPLLTFVLMREHYQVARILLQKPARNPDPLVGALVERGKPDLLQLLLEKNKPSQAALDGAYETALQQKKAEVAAVLKKAGANDPEPPVAVKAGPQYELLSKNPMGEAILATPAWSKDLLIVRGERHLFAIGDKK